MSELNPYASPKFQAGDPLVAAGYKRPTVLGAIGRGTTLFIQCLPRVALIVLTIWIPLELLISYQEYFVLDPEDALAAVRLSMLADAFLGIIATSGVISVGAAALRGEHRSWLQGLGDGLAAWPRMFGTRLLTMLFIALGLLLLVIPGLYLAVRFSLAESVAVIERRGGMHALNRSQQLTRGSFWQFLLLSTLMIGSLLVIGFLAMLPLELFPAMNHWVVSAALCCLIDFAAAWWTLIFVAAYFAATDHETPRPQNVLAAEPFPPSATPPNSDLPASPVPPSPGRGSAAPFS